MDLIDRQAAIKAVEDLPNCYNGYSDTYDKACIIGLLEELPSAERKKGRWERVEDENGDFLCWECSECGERYVMPHHRASYCPNCGADMRGEEDE